jgi:hypothetical protein
MTTDALYRTETAISALSANTLAWNSWAHDSLTALGMSAIRNPLGDRLIHFINSPSGHRAYIIVMMILTKLLRDGHKATQDHAFQSFEYWNGRHCLNCGGRGVMDFEQTECPRCGGTGDRPIPSEYNETIKAGISMLIEAEQYMERQLRARMAPQYAPSHVYAVSGYWDNSAHQQESPEAGWVTPKHDSCE